MNADESVEFLNTIIALPDAAGSKESVVNIAKAAGLPAGDFVEGDPSERWLEIVGRAMAAWGSVPESAVRALFFPLATDPGDVDDFGRPDQSADQTPRPGMLSAVGEGRYGTTRGGQTYATCFVTFQNTGTVTSSPFTAAGLTFEASGLTRDDGGTPTYKGTPDPSIYVEVGGTKTLAPGASVTVPVQANQIGEYGSAPAGDIDICVTQNFGTTFTVTGSTTATGREREARPAYIERCLLAASNKSTGDPEKKYRRAANTANDGTALQRHDDSGDVGITRTQVVGNKSDGTVDLYFADEDGPADAVDVLSANANIEGVVLGVITDPIGVVGALTTYTGQAAIATNIDVHWSARIKASAIGVAAGTYGTPWEALTLYQVGARVQNGTRIYVVTVSGTSAGSGGPTGTGTGITDGGVTWNYVSAATANVTITTDLYDLIVSDTGTLLGTYDIGGVEQTAGAGVLYTGEITDAVHDSRSGLYGVSLTLPSTTTTALPVGNVPVLRTVTGILTVVAG